MVRSCCMSHPYSLSLSSASFTHLLFLGCLSFPLSLNNALSLWISVDRCVGDGCMLAVLLVPRCLSWGRSYVCVTSYWCPGVWAQNSDTLWTHCLRLKYNGYCRQHRKQLQTQQVHRRVEGHEPQNVVLDCKTDRFLHFKTPTKKLRPLTLT